MSESDDPFGDDAEFDAYAEEMDRHGREIHGLVTSYLDDHDIGEDAASQILLGLSLNLRMLAYGLGTEKPSATGLRLDLDRFAREVNDVIRESKKSAEAFVEDMKELLANEETEGDDGEETPEGRES